MEENIKEFKEVLEELAVPQLANEEGKIEALGRRWIVLDVTFFPGFILKENLLGEKLVSKFLYFFGYNYGEVVGERYIKMGLSNDKILKVPAAFSTLFLGWGIPEILEVDFEKGRLLVKVTNDFETESAIKNGLEPQNNYLRGVFAGLFSKLINAKTHATAEFKDGVTYITVEKR